MARVVRSAEEHHRRPGPWTGQSDQEEVALLDAVLEQAAMFQVQVVGVGIGVDLRRRFPVSTSVRTASELPETLAALFKERLLRI